jgi:hypothetical protein
MLPGEPASLAELPAPNPLDPDPAALIREAKRRQRRRYALTGLAYPCCQYGVMYAFASAGQSRR